MRPTKSYAPGRYGQLHYRIVTPEAASQPAAVGIYRRLSL